MKKNLLIFTILFSFMFLLGSSSPVTALFASENTVSVLNSQILLGSGEAPKENGIYVADFVSETKPYNELIFETSITTYPTDYSSLTTIEKEAINNSLSWTINGEAISANSTDYTANVIGKDLVINILKPNTYVIAVSANGVSTSQTIKAKYAVPTQLSISADKDLNQLYETFEDTTLSAEFNLQNYLDNNIEYTYEWTIDNAVQTNTTKTLTITKNMISKIGTMKISCTVAELPLLSANVSLNITTDENFTLNISHEGGELTQTLGDVNSTAPIQFMATIVADSEYRIDWYMKKPNTNTYKKLNATGETFTFKPMIDYTIVGEYKIFAQATLADQIVTSEIVVVTLKSKPIELGENLFEITYEKFDNSSTGVESYKCSIDVGEFCDENKLVWFVGTSAMKIGKEFEFNPEIANEYIITVKLLNEDGSSVVQTISKPLVVEPKALETSNIWVYCGIAAGALVLICIATIIISNKVREKIW